MFFFIDIIAMILVLSVLSEVVFPMREGLKYALVESGEQCVMMDGIFLMHKLYAKNWGMMQKVSKSKSIRYNILNLFSFQVP